MTNSMSMKQLIDAIIEEEGGWKLTNHKDDTDRATYAGIRFGTWAKEFSPVQNDILSLKLFLASTQPDDINHAELRENVISIYIDIMRSAKVQDMPFVIQQPYFSCVVNIGQSSAVRILQNAYMDVRMRGVHDAVLIDGKIGPKTLHAVNQIVDTLLTSVFINAFVERWLAYYFELVVDNAEAWRDYANDDQQHPPPTLRATFLRGWYNRANKYRVNQ